MSRSIERTRLITRQGEAFAARPSPYSCAQLFAHQLKRVCLESQGLSAHPRVQRSSVKSLHRRRPATLTSCRREFAVHDLAKVACTQHWIQGSHSDGNAHVWSTPHQSPQRHEGEMSGNHDVPRVDQQPTRLHLQEVSGARFTRLRSRSASTEYGQANHCESRRACSKCGGCGALVVCAESALRLDTESATWADLSTRGDASLQPSVQQSMSTVHGRSVMCVFRSRPIRSVAPHSDDGLHAPSNLKHHGQNATQDNCMDTNSSSDFADH